MDIVEAMQRENIITLALSARTSEQIKQAIVHLNRWVADHPDDLGIIDAYEQLGLVELALEEISRAEQPQIAHREIAAV